MILKEGNNKLWSKSVQNIKTYDIFYTNDFAKIYKQTKLYMYKHNGNIVIFPFVIKNNMLTSLHYGGMIYKKYDKRFFKEAVEKLCQYCKKNSLKKIIVRNHPFLRTIKIGREIKKEPYIYIDLTKHASELNSAISKLHLKCIKNAFRQRPVIFETRQLKYLKIFHELYRTMLKKKNIIPQDIPYFLKMFTNLKDNLSFACVKFKDEIVAVSILLSSNDNIFMTYGGMNENGYKKYAKHFMIYNLIFRYKKRGYKRLILGTGNNGKDSIYNFKKGFTDRGHYIYTYGLTI